MITALTCTCGHFHQKLLQSAVYRKSQPAAAPGFATEGDIFVSFMSLLNNAWTWLSHVRPQIAEPTRVM